MPYEKLLTQEVAQALADKINNRDGWIGDVHTGYGYIRVVGWVAESPAQTMLEQHVIEIKNGLHNGSPRITVVVRDKQRNGYRSPSNRRYASFDAVRKKLPELLEAAEKALKLEDEYYALRKDQAADRKKISRAAGLEGGVNGTAVYSFSPSNSYYCQRTYLNRQPGESPTEYGIRLGAFLADLAALKEHHGF